MVTGDRLTDAYMSSVKVHKHICFHGETNTSAVQEFSHSYLLSPPHLEMNKGHKTSLQIFFPTGKEERRISKAQISHWPLRWMCKGGGGYRSALASIVHHIWQWFSKCELWGAIETKQRNCRTLAKKPATLHNVKDHTPNGERWPIAPTDQGSCQLKMFGNHWCAYSTRERLSMMLYQSWIQSNPGSS